MRLPATKYLCPESRGGGTFSAFSYVPETVIFIGGSDCRLCIRFTCRYSCLIILYIMCACAFRNNCLEMVTKMHSTVFHQKWINMIVLSVCLNFYRAMLAQSAVMQQ